jgi:hypothetical protein
MNSAFIGRIALGLLPVVSACQAQTKSCTLIGCNDQFQVEISQAGISFPNFAADMVIDGRKASCSAVSTTTSGGCDSGVTVGLRELVTCTSMIQYCAGTGTYVEVLVIAGTPKTVNISLHNGAKIIAERTFQPQYTDYEPNGPGCDPVCKLAMASWSLP